MYIFITWFRVWEWYNPIYNKIDTCNFYYFFCNGVHFNVAFHSKNAILKCFHVIRVHVLLNLSNSLRKIDKMFGKPRIVYIFPNHSIIHEDSWSSTENTYSWTQTFTQLTMIKWIIAQHNKTQDLTWVLQRYWIY